MAIDKAQIESYLSELGLSPEVNAAVLGDLTSNDQRAVQFVGQRLRHDAFTRKTQELSTREQEIQTTANTQVAEYARQLGDAQKRIDKIMTDFQESEISAATANARIRGIKEKFQLSDEDLPTVTPETRKEPVVNQPNIDIEARLKSFETDLVNRLLPDMTAMPMINVIQYDMARQHQELIGKPMTRDEMLDIVRESAKSKTSLDSVWKAKYNIDGLVAQKNIDSAIQADRISQEEIRVRKQTEDALAGVSSRNSAQPHAEGVLGRKFNLQFDEQTLPNGSNGNKATNQPENQQTPKLSGEQRAINKWIERRTKGIPLGKMA